GAEAFLVDPQPELDPVPLDPPGRPPSCRALAAEPPPRLIYGPPVAPPVLRPGELERGSDGGAPASDDRDLDGAGGGHGGDWFPSRGRPDHSPSSRGTPPGRGPKTRPELPPGGREANAAPPAAHAGARGG